MTAQLDFLVDDILQIGNELESDHIPGQRALKITTRRKMQRVAQQEALADVLPKPPGPGECYHIISAAKFDFWTWVPQMAGWIGQADELYCSTWTASRQNVIELFELVDAGKISPGKVSFLTGLYFKRRESAVYSMLLDGLRARGGRFRSFKNHCKILLLSNAARRTWLTVTGSTKSATTGRSTGSIGDGLRKCSQSTSPRPPVDKPDEKTVLEKMILLLVSIPDRGKVARVAVEKLGVAPGDVHEVISTAFQQIREAASFDTEEQAGQAIVRLNDLYERSLAVQDCKTALSCQKELAKLQDLYSALKRRRPTVDQKVIEAMKQ